MPPRTLGFFAAALFACGSVLGAQNISIQGTVVPGPGGAQGPVLMGPGAPPRDASAAEQPKGTSRIRGRVVAADTGTPLRRAQVRLNASEPRVAQVTTTDAEGRYEFASLPAGRYSIVVSRNGYVTLQYGQQRPFEPGKPLQLAAAEASDKIDFSLPRGSVIAGKVTDEFGEPVAGTRMQAQRYQYMPGGQRRLVSTNTGTGPFTFLTDDLGEFRVYGLMPGTYVLSATPAGSGITTVTATSGGVATFATSMSTGTVGTASGIVGDQNDGYATTYYPGTTNVEEAQAITLDLGQESRAYFSLVSARMGRISGMIRNSLGRPAERVMVSLRTPGAAGSFAVMGMSAMGPDGTFNVANVPPGDHFIDVRPMPMMGGPNRNAAQATEPAEEEYASVPITIGAQDLTGLVITTGPGATASGRLIFEGMSPRPTNPNPLRVNVAPDPTGGPMMAMFANPTDNGAVDEAGRFQLRGLYGRVLFRVGAQGWNLKSVTLNGVDITDMPFEARPSTEITGLEIRLTDQVTSLSGSARNARGEIAKDYVLVIFPESMKEGAIATRFTRTLRPDQDGRFTLKGMPPGEYFGVAVESLEQGGEWDPAFQQQVRPRAKSFRLSEGQALALDFQLAP